MKSFSERQFPFGKKQKSTSKRTKTICLLLKRSQNQPKSYRKVIKYLEANEVIDGEEAYKTLSLKVNKLIEINNTLIENKSKKRTTP
ncbi:hypothetical protein [Labilibaculum sp.]|uniref:hypothetical protein n=1 Tax=Labilibaculum sp. TaxID=2060723 RepID=UPI003566A3F8